MESDEEKSDVKKKKNEKEKKIRVDKILAG